MVRVRPDITFRVCVKIRILIRISVQVRVRMYD